MKSLSLIGILVDKRTKSAPQLQEVLTKYGDSVLSRVGIHDPNEEDQGIITLTVRDEEDKLEQLRFELSNIDGVLVKSLRLK